MAVALTALAASREGYPGHSLAHVTFWWVASMTLTLSAAAWPIRPAAGRSLNVRWPSVAQGVLWAVMMLAAALPRFVMLDRFPSVLDADEAAFMIRAVEYREGLLPNPFGTGFFSNPQMYPVAQSMVADGVGQGVAAHRAISALIGTIGVLATWRLGLRLFPPTIAVAAALLLAAWPLHLHMSRVALNNITDPTFLILALLFLLRSLTSGKRLDAVICGFALACGFYGYYGGRAFGAVMLAVLIALAIQQRLGIRRLLWTISWIAAGFVSAAMPLLVAFWKNPAEFGGHMAMVSSISITTFREDPGMVGRLFLRNLREGLIYPFAGNDIGYFRHDPPFLGWQLAILLAVGSVAIVARAVTSRDLRAPTVIFLPWLILVAGISLTIPIAGQRYLAITPFWALAVASGIALLAKTASMLASSSRAWIQPVVVFTVVAAIGATNLQWLASEERQIDTYGDYRTMMAWDLGWRSGNGEGEIIWAGPPFVFAGGFPNLTFLAPNLVQAEIQHSMTSPADVPSLAPASILVLTPEREGERCVVESVRPRAIVAEVYARDGVLLYIAIATALPVGWSTETSPAGTEFRLVDESPCPEAMQPIIPPPPAQPVAMSTRSSVNFDIDRAVERGVEADNAGTDQ